MRNNIVEVQNWGTLPYAKAWERQESLFKQIIEVKLRNRNAEPEAPIPTPNYLIICEHPHVYTLGKSGKNTHLLKNKEWLATNDIDFFETDRGGDITYHGPGQLVVYPILDLDNFFTDIHKYLRCMEQAVIDTLSDFSIQADRYEGYTGVWIEPYILNARKICAMGVRASRWVTMHGLALNVNADVNYFNHIIPCGIADKAVTSMQLELKKHIDTAQVAHALISHFAEIFDMKIKH